MSISFISITRSHAKLQKIAIPSLFKPSTDRPGPAVKASILRDPLTMLTRKRSMALPPLDVSQKEPEKKEPWTTTKEKGY